MMSDQVSDQAQESNSYKRNLHFGDYSSDKKQKYDSFFMEEDLFSSHEERKLASVYDSDDQLKEDQISSSSVEAGTPQSFGRKIRAAMDASTYNKTRLKSGQFNFENDEEESEPQSFELLKLKQELFQVFIVTLIQNFNPSLTKEEHLIQLSKSFSIFNRILRAENTDSILITGVSSTGKSSSVDWSLKTNKNFGKILVDCQHSDSEVSFIFKLNEALRTYFEIKTQLDIDYEQFQKKSLFAMLEPIIQKSNKKAVLVIENAELLISFTVHKVIYNLSELAINSRRNIKIFLVTKNPRFIQSLDRRQRSRFKLITLEMLKLNQPIIEIFLQRFNSVEKQLFTERGHMFEKFSKRHGRYLEMVTRQWLQKVMSLFCQNQSLKNQLYMMSTGIENHLNAACWIFGHLFSLEKVEADDNCLLEKQLIHSYKMFFAETNSLPSKNLLKNSNLDQKIFMALMYTMLANDRRPYSYKTIIRISYEVKAEKIENCYYIYMSENNLKKAFDKLVDKKIICFDEGTECEKKDREMRVSMNFLDIKDAIINEETYDLPNFVKQIFNF